MNDTKDRKLQQCTSGQKVQMMFEGFGERVDSFIAIQNTESPMFKDNLMETVCERENLLKALRKVKSNKGCAGIDGMNVNELSGFLKENWVEVKSELLAGKYTPEAVMRIEIPKPGSTGIRKLGIPSVLDRFIQQAILQTLQNKWDRKFSDNSYGFRPKRSARQAVLKAQSYLKSGYSYVVDIDLEKFFDRISHDRLMSRLAVEIRDKRVLKLIRLYLKAGIMENGLITTPIEGTPQGGPLSPFLSNIVLDELDKELERRNLKFVRYADDSNIYVKSLRSGKRVMSSITSFICNRLKLRVNQSKSAVDIPANRQFLGFTFTNGKASNRRKISNKSLKRFKSRIRHITRRNKGQSLEVVVNNLNKYLNGWKSYFGICETLSVLRDLDSWIRRRLRCLVWKQWKVYANRRKELINRNVSESQSSQTAFSAKGPWRISGTKAVQLALNRKFFDSIGVVRLLTN
jgi:RNA-directed DNA polymerase